MNRAAGGSRASSSRIRPRVPAIPRAGTFTYLGRQVLDRQPKALREFMLRTSLPEEFNADMCAAILRPFHSRKQNWTAMINALVEKNLFALQVGTDGGWVRYHPLFREYLQTRMKAECPEDVQPILERLTHFYEDSYDWEKAYFTCRQLGNPEGLAELVEHAGTSMLQHSFTTLEGWMNSLPPGLVASRPGLVSLRGSMAITRGNYREAINLLNKAETAYRGKKEVEGLALAFTRRSNAYRNMGKYEIALEQAEEVLQLTESEQKLQATYAEALRIKGLCLFRLGHSGEAIGFLQHSLSLFSALKKSGSITILLVETGMVHAATGDMDAADAAFQKALKIWGKENNLSSQADVLNNIGTLNHQSGEYERAVEALDQGLILARKSRKSQGRSLDPGEPGRCVRGGGDLRRHGRRMRGHSPSQINGRGGSSTSTCSWRAPTSRCYSRISRRPAPSCKKGDTRLQANPSLYERGLKALIEGPRPPSRPPAGEGRCQLRAIQTMLFPRTAGTSRPPGAASGWRLP